jgi:hypothetical protein
MNRIDDCRQRTLIAWAKLGVIYNGILLLEGLSGLLILRHIGRVANHLCVNVFDSSIYLPLIVLIGLAANGFYLLGPSAEVLIERWLGYRIGRWRLLLFAAGLLFSMFVVLIAFHAGWIHISGFLK